MQEALDLWAAEMKFKTNPKIAPRALAACFFLAHRKTPDALVQKGFFIVAPRPGLEPGTYGLTGKQARKKPL